VNFAASAASYDRFMGRYSTQLAPQLADLAKVVAGQRVLDVGCGPGALTAELVKRLGAEAVSAVDPSESFVAALRDRLPAVDVQRASAEALPFPDRTFDTALAQLVVHFMTHPVAGLGEMRRVTRPEGVVAACVWDFASDRGPLGPFWEAARQLDPEVENEVARPGTRQGHLFELFQAAGLREIEESTVSAAIEHGTIEDWWAPFTLGVGPAGIYVAGLDPDRQAQLRDLCGDLLPDFPFVQTAHAWAVRGIV
jgi:ubiquinone/menaquinone biosynthesis C-methylase UbiE